MSTDLLPVLRPDRPAWNKGRIISQKRPLLPKHVWSIRVRLEMAGSKRDLALFNMAIDSKLRGCDLVCLKVQDVFASNRVKERTSITQRKTGKPVRFEISEITRQSLERWIADPALERRSRDDGFGFTSGRAVCTPASICLPVNTPGSCESGSCRSGWTRVPTAPIRCGGRRLPNSTRRPATFVPSNFFLAIRRWTALFGILVWISMMRLLFPSA